eukprot:1144453-Pelagomonas_calceolata.AAC.1
MHDIHADRKSDEERTLAVNAFRRQCKHLEAPAGLASLDEKCAYLRPPHCSVSRFKAHRQMIAQTHVPHKRSTDMLI